MNIHKRKDDLQTLPGVGPKLAQCLRDLGFHSSAELRGRDPEKMYSELCKLREESVDRCVLYVFRCAVHSLSTEHIDPKLLKWWNWKDNNL